MYRSTPPHLLNVAATVKSTEFLGPGKRAVVWVRGCYANCRGCIAPDWQSPMPENFQTVDSLLQQLVVENEDIQGLTISGGEPFLQALALHLFISQAKEIRDLDVIIYSGYTYEKLSTNHPRGSSLLLDVCDVLIDGRYKQEQNNGVGMYGSANQRVHYLTSRLQNHNFSTVDRKVEIRFDGTQLFLVGVPGMHVSNGFFSAVETTKTDIGVTTTECSLEEAGYECK